MQTNYRRRAISSQSTHVYEVRDFEAVGGYRYFATELDAARFAREEERLRGSHVELPPISVTRIEVPIPRNAQQIAALMNRDNVALERVELVRQGREGS